MVTRSGRLRVAETAATRQRWISMFQQRVLGAGSGYTQLDDHRDAHRGDLCVELREGPHQRREVGRAGGEIDEDAVLALLVGTARLGALALREAANVAVRNGQPAGVPDHVIEVVVDHRPLAGPLDDQPAAIEARRAPLPMFDGPFAGTEDAHAERPIVREQRPPRRRRHARRWARVPAIVRGVRGDATVRPLGRLG